MDKNVYGKIRAIAQKRAIVKIHIFCLTKILSLFRDSKISQIFFLFMESEKSELKILFWIWFPTSGESFLLLRLWILLIPLENKETPNLGSLIIGAYHLVQGIIFIIWLIKVSLVMMPDSLSFVFFLNCRGSK